MYEVHFRSEVVVHNEYRLLSREQQRAMLRVLESAPGTQKRLSGPLRGCLRYRCQDLRVVYRIDEQAKTVTIIAIGKRRDNEAYDTATERV